MDWSQAGNQPFPNQWHYILICTIKNKLQWSFDQNTAPIQEHEFENSICKMETIRRALNMLNYIM